MNNIPSIITYFKKLATVSNKICQNKIYIPTICILCEKYHSKYQVICDNCYKLLTPIGHSCDICCKPLSSIYQSICADCNKNPPAFTKVFSAFVYEEPLKTLIHNFKYHRGLFVTSLLVELLLKAPINQNDLGLIIPTPLSKNSIKNRGYNQAAILANKIAKKLKTPYANDYLRKIINTPKQVSISGIARRNNLNNAFACSNSNYKTITIIDDILTTGSTAHAMAQTLKNCGVEKVYIWCCARAAGDAK